MNSKIIPVIDKVFVGNNKIIELIYEISSFTFINFYH